MRLTQPQYDVLHVTHREAFQIEPQILTLCEIESTFLKLIHRSNQIMDSPKNKLLIVVI